MQDQGLKLRLVPITLKASNEFVERFHRHHKKTQVHKFSVAISDGERVRGVATVGRPVARMLDDGFTLEVTRCCTDGAGNGCSMLYGAAWRVARELGYNKCITYTLATEDGGSLRAAGWICKGECGGGTWDREGREREDKHSLEKKVRWEIGRIF